MRGVLLIGLLLASPACADEVILPATTLERAGPVMVVWRPDRPAAGALLVEWTDSLGRVVTRVAQAVDSASPEVALQLDLRRAVTAENHLIARFVPEDGGGERRSTTDFLVRPPAGWDRYQVLMWQDQSQAGLAALPALGVTGTALLRPLLRVGQTAERQRLAAGLRFYTENLATDFYASYHRFTPDRPVTWRFDATRSLHQSAPADLSVFERVPSLADPAWLATIAARLQDIAWRETPLRPLFHNLADEAGIADLAAAWDFDLSPASLTGMRTWLASRYGDLARLNHAWGSDFTTWETVVPTLTEAALRDDRAVPAWMEFKTWMDIAFARAVRVGTEAVHRGDPSALAGLEGAQVPGWGGYDYGRLADAVDIMEIYDAAHAIDIARSLNPALRVLTTVGDSPTATRDLWHALLLGGSGVVLWDADHAFVSEAGTPGPQSAALTPLLRQLSGGVGAQIMAARPAPAQVAILYSQASFRLQWLFDRRAAGTRWEDRDAEAETADDNGWRAANDRAAAAFAGLGVPVRWITPETLASGALAADGIRVLVLPHSLALADGEVDAIKGFGEAGGLVLADVVPGTRDALGRPRVEPPLGPNSSLGASLELPAALTSDADLLSSLAGLLARAGVARPVQCFDPDGEPARGIDIRLLDAGPIHFYAIQSLTGDRNIELRLARPRRQWAWLFPGSGAYVPLAPSAPDEPPQAGRTVTLPAGEPLIVAVSDEEPPRIAFQAPPQAALGSLVTVHLKPARMTKAFTSFVQVEVVDPSGHAVQHLSDLVLVPPEGADWHLRLALNDQPGIWNIGFLDTTLGDVVSATLEVR